MLIFLKSRDPLTKKSARDSPAEENARDPPTKNGARDPPAKKNYSEICTKQDEHPSQAKQKPTLPLALAFAGKSGLGHGRGTFSRFA